MSYFARAVLAAAFLVTLGCDSKETATVSAAAVAVDTLKDGSWTDPATKLSWQAKDSGYWITDIKMAEEYCSNVHTKGWKWEVPTLEELKSVRWVGPNQFGHPIRGNIQLTGGNTQYPGEGGYEWFSGPGGPRLFNFAGGETTVLYNARVLCVRRSGE